VGFFAIGERPTGSKDPFALRRAALGILRIVVEGRLRLPLQPLFTVAFDGYGTLVAAADRQRLAAEILAFLADRLKVHLREQGVRHDLVAAVFADGSEDDIVRLLARVDALRVFLDTDDGANLLVAYRRASNIVRIEETKDNRRYEGEADERLLAEPQEIDLHRSLTGARAGIDAALTGERFSEAMTILAGLRSPVDAFFDHVQVNCSDPRLRINRLKLLSQIRSALGGVADFSQIEG
jgi:glycyl-tRNA synthetase beta chain